MKFLSIIISLSLISNCNPIGLQRRLNGESSAEIAESAHRFWCTNECDRQYHENWCKTANFLDQIVLCKYKTSQSRCLKECYTPYCTCNEKPQDWNYGMCKHYCYKESEKSNEKYDENIKK